ncbi:MAG: hypothetical protein DRO67_00660 [Candidatus Asgardarchaeum californiense]|nr:MAG: hypothetical protein DRO67_00660 [Candidatus Asgardarchaeum californiense]
MGIEKLERGAEFLKELKVLLEKYKMSIGFEVDDGSDTYGISGQRMEIRDKDNDIIFTSKGQWYIDSNSLK